MRIILCSTDALFVEGGARQIVEWLQEELASRGHEVERIYLPEIDTPELILRQMAAFRMINFERADRVICFRPQSHLICHDHKILWFIHHVRAFYDQWDTEYRPLPADERHTAIRDAVRRADSVAIAEAAAVFTNSQVVSDRLLEFNGAASEVLYPPMREPSRFTSTGMNDEIVYIARVLRPKRQHLLVEALEFTMTPVRVRLCGESSGPEYPEYIEEIAARLGVGDRVTFDHRWISESEKELRLAECLAVAYVAENEDSYGYSTLEAAHASKPVLTLEDSGGVLEFVEDGVNGRVVAADPRAIAGALDEFYTNRVRTAEMGTAARSRVDDLNISWEHVIDRLLA